jgi:Tfp pilus assembly protein PilF
MGRNKNNSGPGRSNHSQKIGLMAGAGFAATVFGLAGLVAAQQYGPQKPAATATQAKPAASYDYHFGPNPFLPSEAQAAFQGFLKPSDFPTAEYCGKCHEDIHREWRESAHSNSFREPFYVKNVNLLINGKGIEYTRHCEGCHNPIALFSGALTKGSTVNRAFDQDGITCSVCHSIVKIQNTSGTGSYVMGVPAVMVNEDGTPRPGLPSYDEIFAHPELHKRAVMRDFYKTPEFCAVCHKAALPEMINDYKWLRAFSVYDEWQQSSWSRQSPLPFYKKDQEWICQTCHMPAVPSKSDYGEKKGWVASHRWLAANTAIPFYYGYDTQLAKVADFLKQDRFGIDFFAIRKGTDDKEPLVAPMDREKFTLTPGDTAQMSVVIQNKGIGHTLVPEQRDFYESWVEFEVKDTAGHEIYHSGFLKPDGFLDENAHTYTNRLISKEGKLLDLHQVWETRVKAYDNTIGPGRSDLVRYEFEIPKNAIGPLTVIVNMKYRRFRRGFTNWVLGKSVDYPIVVMATKKIDLQLGENAPSSASNANDYLRWNNYGIALLDQQQYWLAAEAFEKVTQLKPDYVDGYVNIAIANYTGERYDLAGQALAKALQMSPSYARALYYQALLDRRGGHLDEAAARLKQVQAQFPRFRDAYDQLGDIYYIQKKYELARQQYVGLQGIDPDDSSAHHHLSQIYARLGMRKEALEEAKLFNEQKDDPSALNYALEFFHTHPEIARESVPWHLHSDHTLANGKPQVAQGTEAQ